MKHALICGAGKMGIAIGVAMKKLGYELSVYDNSSTALNTFQQQVGNFHSYDKLPDVKPLPDIVISSLPYMFNSIPADYCINRGLRYCDLGGSVPVSQKIQEAAQKAKAPVMTDLGLAPGWVNIIAEECYQIMGGADTVEMRVGGIPRYPDAADPLKYQCTWSLDGLLNEYFDDCVVLENGIKKTVPGMSDLRKIIVGVDHDEMESFNTSGASAYSIDTMQQRGVKNCIYQTIRWRGHRDLVYFLKNVAKLPEFSLRQIFKACEGGEDMVIIDVRVTKEGNTCRTTKELYGQDGFTAMQRCTAFPIAAVADILAGGHLDTIKTPAYCDIPFAQFNANLKQLGL